MKFTVKLNARERKRVATFIAMSLLCVLVGAAAIGLGLSVALDLYDTVSGWSDAARWCLAVVTFAGGLWALALAVGYLDQLHDFFKMLRIFDEIEKHIDNMDDSDGNDD